MGLSTDGWLTLAVVAVATLVFISDRFRPDLVALLVMVALPILGLVPAKEALGSFGDPTVVILIAVFILGQALTATGVSHRIATALYRLTQESATRLRIGLMIAGMMMSLFMNNVTAAAVLIPAAMEVARKQKTPPSRLLLPLAYATQLAGMATLFTTANLIASSLLVAAGYAPFGVLDFLPIGGLVALSGLLYLTLIGWRLLPAHNPTEREGKEEHLQEPQELLEFYALPERLWIVEVQPDSPLAGKSLAESGIGQRWGLCVLAMRGGDGRFHFITPESRLEAGSQLLISGREERIRALEADGLRAEEANLPPESLLPDDGGLLEVLIPPRSRAVGQTLRDLHFRQRYGLSGVALWREGRRMRTDVGGIPLRFGDALLVYGPEANLTLLKSGSDFLPLSAPATYGRTSKAGWAIGIFLGALALTAFHLLPVEVALLAGAAFVILAGAISMDEGYQAIDWRSVFIVAGMIPAGMALNRSGAAAWLATHVLHLLAPWGKEGLVIGFTGLTVVLTQLIPGGAAIPTLLVPIAIHAAEGSGIPPHLLAQAIAIVTGASFLTPFSHPANLLVMGPGGYRNRDYLRAGLPLALLVAVITTVLVILRL